MTFIATVKIQLLKNIKSFNVCVLQFANQLSFSCYCINRQTTLNKQARLHVHMTSTCVLYTGRLFTPNQR